MSVMLTVGCAPADEGDDAASALPGGYQVRLDSERSDPGEFRLTEEEDGAVHIVTGPAGIAFHPEDTVRSGDFRAQAGFTQHNAPPGYREAFGLFVGGRDLETPDQEYTYLLVRTSGDYLVKRRVGETLTVLVDWTPHPAVVRVESDGDTPLNLLAVEASEGETRFVVNGVVVHRMPTSEARPYGVVGLRSNHRLDVRVHDFSLGALPASAPTDTTTSP